MAPRSRILAWRIPWTEEPGKPQSMGFKESDMTERLTLSLTTRISIYLFFVGRGNTIQPTTKIWVHLKKCLFISLAALGLSFSTQGLHCVFRRAAPAL